MEALALAGFNKPNGAAHRIEHTERESSFEEARQWLWSARLEP